MTNWKALKHHRGTTLDVPKIVADMLLGGEDSGEGRDQRFEHHLTLQDRLYRHGQCVQAAPAAIDVIFQTGVVSRFKIAAVEFRETPT